jgi:hypothetical protein
MPGRFPLSRLRERAGDPSAARIDRERVLHFSRKQGESLPSGLTRGLASIASG